MRWIKFLFILAVTISLVGLCQWHHPFGVPTPPLGKFINPFTGFWQNGEVQGRLPDINLRFEQLSGEVRVVFDERLVPHIFAANLKDASFVQGYITAKYRLWQMDISTRSVAGRLSEVLGERLLGRDKNQRRKGLVFAAENALASWKRNPEEIQLVEAYSDGVNAYIETLKPYQYPLEFKILNYQPEPWTPLKSALFFKNMAETLCSRNYDLQTTNARNALGTDLFDFLYPEYNPKQSPVIPTEVKYAFDTISVNRPSTPPTMIGGVFPFDALPQPSEFLGSNNWAVSGDKTASGKPILCNDPHLGLTLPSIWYEIQLHTPEVNSYGVSLPAVPGILIGFNEYIAWGMTNVGQDVLDWYQIKWTDETKKKYLVDGQELEVEEMVEIIKVRGKKESVLDTVKYTVWGPIVYESKDSPYRDLAMRWVAHDLPKEKAAYEIGVFNKLIQSKNYDDYREAINNYDSPAQNFVFASKEGDIAMTVGGKFPLKRNQQGRFIQDGSLSDNAWQGFIPKSQIPRVVNPIRGFVASANQHSTDQSYPYYYVGGFDDYRGRYINQTLEKMENITVEDMMALQNDNHSLEAAEMLPLLLELLSTNQLDKAALELLEQLKQWDYSFDMDELAPAAFVEWSGKVYELTFDEIYALRDSFPVAFPETWRLIELLDTVPGHPIFDRQSTNERENAKDIVKKAFVEMWEDSKNDFSKAGFNWDRYKKTRIAHLGRIPGLTVSDFSVGGYRNAPNAIQRGFGPSWRMIVELGPEVKAYGVYPGGQSGHPGSKYYDQMINQWAAGEYNSLNFMKTPEDIASPLFNMTFGK